MTTIDTRAVQLASGPRDRLLPLATSALVAAVTSTRSFLRELHRSRQPARTTAPGEEVRTAVGTAPGLDLNAFIANDYPRVVAAVGMITGNRQDAADAVQDALVGLIAKPPAKPIENLPAWLIVVASNRARDRHRTRMAEQRAFAKLGSIEDSVEDELSMLDLDLQRALDALPPQQRRICAMHYLADQSVDQVAAALGVTAGTVKTQLFRGRKALAAALRVESDAEAAA